MATAIVAALGTGIACMLLGGVPFALLLRYGKKHGESATASEKIPPKIPELRGRRDGKAVLWKIFWTLAACLSVCGGALLGMCGIYILASGSGVGVGIGVLALAAACIGCFFTCWRKANEASRRQFRQTAAETRGGDWSEKDPGAILAEIKAVNDGIADEILSGQIDHIRDITAKILEFQEKRPEKAPQLQKFLRYYLPATLKILRSYGELEGQGVSGENITAAMERVEDMMGKVVEGFEKQLDQLYQGESIDIASNVEVLERMLESDGLAGGQELRLKE